MITPLESLHAWCEYTLPEEESIERENLGHNPHLTSQALVAGDQMICCYACPPLGHPELRKANNSQSAF